MSADPLDYAVPIYQCPFDAAEKPNNPYSPSTVAKYGSRGKSRFSYARIFPYSADAGVLSGLPSRSLEEELGNALYTWPYRFGTLRCVTGANGVKCLYDCERGTDIRSESTARFLVENHRGMAQSRIGGTAYVNRSTWWQAPSSASGGHATLHRSGRVQYSMNTLAFDLHVNNIPPSAQPHTAFLITRRPPGCRNANGFFDGYEPVTVGK